ncbi:hypothetical protein JTE90_011801 [Oedothorax gibbosus]|uniref:Uncharacterized protein n=1 Tax=Oedothorax gibbosus TaxID=931172 RepID=A0AAV6VRT0_9ARAC|nr:hypothetical protein JTE90_011801 [Oedothorax gibbosus]
MIKFVFFAACMAIALATNNLEVNFGEVLIQSSDLFDGKTLKVQLQGRVVAEEPMPKNDGVKECGHVKAICPPNHYCHKHFVDDVDHSFCEVYKSVGNECGNFNWQCHPDLICRERDRNNIGLLYCHDLDKVTATVSRGGVKYSAEIKFRRLELNFP